MHKQWLNYHHLLYFMTIANEGGVSKASAKLKLGQSTLSAQLAQFEEQLGMMLFERRQKRLHLTEAGRIALQYARDIFRLGDEMQDALHDRRQVHRVSVQIGALECIPKALVVELVTEAQKEHECSVALSEGLADELWHALRAHQIDLALLNYQPSAADCVGMKVRLAGQMPVVVMGSAKFSKLADNFPQSLNGQPFLMPGKQSRLRHDTEQFFRQHGLGADIVLEAQDTSVLTLLAGTDTGLIAVGAALADNLQRTLGLLTLGTLDDVYEELWLVSAERRIENPVATYLFKKFNLKAATDAVASL